jgi:hypothetical protein
VLDAEALALTRLSTVPGCKDHIVPFHGYIADSHAIVMGAVPLALSAYIEEKANAAKKHMSTSTMFDPVQGMAEWHGLAKKLVAGLDWLHNGARMVHGDIKPYNFLLRPRPIANDSDSDEFPFEPLFADFSSAQPIGDCPDSPDAPIHRPRTPVHLGAQVPRRRPDSSVRRLLARSDSPRSRDGRSLTLPGHKQHAASCHGP